MPKSELSSQNTLRPLASSSDERRRTGRYIAGGTALAVTLLALHHVLMRGSSSLAGIFVPALIMTIYVLWVLYSARRDRQKAARRASAMELANVVNNAPMPINNVDHVTTTNELRKPLQDVT
ncbi:uncharacterized protein LOC124309240 [Neodiprion virginianus]|uniref:Uncharacterized protein LOC107220362 n=1 Tax=Neodiprion lecontei TaxID=441921 RepID=A0A6J0BKW3_NEOLC|nr:uncharacterized protein LOC107220362 [Neodiprion lecontei]XP_046434931.1 uncharacterized protein LOC124186886 [Neodiprion fabricii]XP_046628635.1 uncharacterized protein LOC124309240 [Neodiprion virginianus]